VLPHGKFRRGAQANYGQAATIPTPIRRLARNWVCDRREDTRKRWPPADATRWKRSASKPTAEALESLIATAGPNSAARTAS